MGVLLPIHCPSCAGRAKYVYSAANLLRTVADVVLGLFAFAPFKLWFRCTECGQRFKSQ